MRNIFFVMLITIPHLSLAEKFSFDEIGLCSDGENLYAPVVELERDRQKVLIVGMYHYGTKSYFARVKENMESWIDSDPSKVTILTELYTCRSPVVEIKNGTEIEVSKVTEIANNPQANLKFVRSKIGKALGVSPCVLDIDGINYRPSYVVERNKKSCSSDAEIDFSCHWNMTYPRGSNIKTYSGDIVMDQQSPASQFIGSLGYRKWNVTSKEQNERRNQIFAAYMIDYRNKNLVENSMRALDSSDRVILPWGSFHNKGVNELLVAKGFRVKEKWDIKYANPKDADVSKSMKETIASFVEMAPPREGHCIEKTTSTKTDKKPAQVNRQTR